MHLGVWGGTHRLLALSEYAIFLFGATIYLFTRSSLQGRGFSYRDLWHYLPGLAYILTITFYYIVVPVEIVNERVQSGELQRSVYWFMGSGLVVNTFYWAWSYRLFLGARRSLMLEVSYAVKTRFFHQFLLAVAVCLAFWWVVYTLGVVKHTWFERQFRPYLWLSIAMLILFLAFYCFTRPELFQILGKAAPKKYAQSKFSTKELDALKARLDTLMEEKKPFLNRQLLKSDIADMLGINQPEVSRLLNERMGMTFFEYVNYHRIREFIEIAKTERAKQLTFFGIAQEAGFNSKTTFNKAFKELMGTSPTQYFAQQSTGSA